VEAHQTPLRGRLIRGQPLSIDGGGELLIYLHDETDTGHEELFFVAQGAARFSVDGDEFDTPAGTFVHVVEPSAIRGAWAQEAGCVLLVIGGKPGTAYRVQDWELEEFGLEG
jgi:hypothetical protein